LFIVDNGLESGLYDDSLSLEVTGIYISNLFFYLLSIINTPLSRFKDETLYYSVRQSI